MEEMLKNYFGINILQDDDSIILAFLVVLLALAGIAFLLRLFKVIVGMIYAKKNGAKNWGLLLLPFGEQYVYGQLADQYEDKNAKTKFPVYYIGFVIAFILNYTSSDVSLYLNAEEFAKAVGFVGFLVSGIYVLVSVLYNIYNYFVYYRIMAYKNRENAIVWLILSIPLAGLPFIVFQLVYLNKQGHTKDEMVYVSADISDKTSDAE